MCRTILALVNAGGYSRSMNALASYLHNVSCSCRICWRWEGNYSQSDRTGFPARCNWSKVSAWNALEKRSTEPGCKAVHCRNVWENDRAKSTWRQIGPCLNLSRGLVLIRFPRFVQESYPVTEMLGPQPSRSSPKNVFRFSRFQPFPRQRIWSNLEQTWGLKSHFAPCQRTSLDIIVFMNKNGRLFSAKRRFFPA